MADFLTELSFEEVKTILQDGRNKDYMQNVYRICSTYYGLIDYMIEMIEHEEVGELSDIDKENALLVNRNLPFALVENETTEFTLWAQAYVLLCINYINLYENNFQQTNEFIDEFLYSINVVKRLLLLGNCLSKLLCVSNMFLEKYERINTLCPDGFRISKMYIDSLMGKEYK